MTGDDQHEHAQHEHAQHEHAQHEHAHHEDGGHVGGEHAAHTDHSGHEQLFRRRFWLSLVLSIPVIVFSEFVQDVVPVLLSPAVGAVFMSLSTVVPSTPAASATSTSRFPPSPREDYRGLDADRATTRHSCRPLEPGSQALTP